MIFNVIKAAHTANLINALGLWNGAKSRILRARSGIFGLPGRPEAALHYRRTNYINL